MAKATGKVSIGARAAAATGVLKTALNSIAYIAIIQAVIAVANTIITKFDEVVNAYQNGITKLKDLSSEIKSLESEQSSLNSELKESKERLYELQQLEMPTLFEKDEIENLKEYNKQLELQIRLKNLELEQKKQEANKTAQETFKSSQIDDYVYDDPFTENFEWWEYVLNTISANNYAGIKNVFQNLTNIIQGNTWEQQMDYLKKSENSLTNYEDAEQALRNYQIIMDNFDNYQKHIAESKTITSEDIYNIFGENMLEKLNVRIDDFTAFLDKMGTGDYAKKYLLQLQDKSNKAKSSLDDYISNLSERYQEWQTELLGLNPDDKNNEQRIKQLNEAIERAADIIDYYSRDKNFTDVYNNADYSDTVVKLEALAKAGKLTEDTFWNVEGIESFAAALEAVGTTDIDTVIHDIINEVQKSDQAEQSAADGFENLSDKIAKIKENASGTMSDIQTFSDAIDKINNGESLDYDGIMNLIAIEPSIAQNIVKVADGYTIAVDDLIAANNKYKESNKDSIEDEIKSVTESIAEKEALMPKLLQQKEQWEKELELHISDERDTELQLRIDGIDGQIEELNELKSVLATLNITLNEFNNSSSIEAVSLEQLSNGYDLLNDVSEEYNENGTINLSTLQKIKDTYPKLKSVIDNYLSGIINENELISELSNAYKTDEDNYYKYLLLKLGYDEDYIKSAYEGNDNIVDYFAENYKIDLKNFQSYISRKQAIQEAFDKMVGGGISEFWTEEGGYTDSFLNLKDDARVIIDGIIDEYKEAISDLDFYTKREQLNEDLNGIKDRTYSVLNAGNDSDSSSSSNESSKTFNWIETAIEKVSKAASRLGNIVSNTFKSWTDRNSALKKQISEVNKEIELQQKAYEVYTQKADSVGLSDYWTDKVRNGSIDISVITDEDLADKIDEFKEWYDKAQDCKEAVDELKESLSELYKTSFDNVIAKFGDIISEIDFNKSMLEEKISRSAQSSYVSFDKNQAALRKNIGYYERLIAQEKRNIAQLEKEKAELTAILRLGIQNGTIIEGTEEWAAMRDKINDVTLAVERANTSLLDYGESINEIYEKLFDNISKNFDHKLNEIQHLSSSYDIGISMLEAKGYLGSVNFYTALQDSQRESLGLLKQELASLQKAFAESGAEEYSDEWFEMRAKILDVNKAIREGELSLLEYAKALREIEWEHFDYLQERISDITTEADFLIDLLDGSTLYDDKGNFTDKGLAALGLHAQNYNVYMAQADKYYRELLSVEKELASDPYNTDLVKRKEELLELQQKSILAAEDEKQAMIDLAKSGIEAELNALKELIRAYTDALDSAKSLHDYQRKIADQTSEIASLEKQLLAYENDSSEEARVTKQKLQSGLDKAKDDLKETEYEKYISEQKELLDNLYADYEENMNRRLDNVDALLEDMIRTVNDNAGEISDTLSDTAREVGYELSDSMQIIWSNAAGTITDAVSLYGDNFSDELTTVNQALSQIETNTAAFIEAANNFASQSISEIKSEIGALSNAISGSQSGFTDNGSDSSVGSDTSVEPAPSASPAPAPNPAPVTNPPPEKEIEIGGKINAGNALIYDYAGAPVSEGERQVFANDPIYTVLGELNGFLKVRWHKLNSGVTGWFRKTDVTAYKNGGLANYTGLAQVDGTPSKPEYVLNPDETKNFLALNETLKHIDLEKLNASGILPKLEDFVNTNGMLSDIRTLQRAEFSSAMGDVNITIPIERVEDYNDFVNQLRNDRQFEKLVQAMTVDRAVGKSALAKNKFRW